MAWFISSMETTGPSYFGLRLLEFFESDATPRIPFRPQKHTVRALLDLELRSGHPIELIPKMLGNHDLAFGGHFRFGVHPAEAHLTGKKIKLIPPAAG